MYEVCAGRPLVAPRARVLAYDRVGIGASDPVSPLALAIQVADLAALAHEAGGGCVLAGHSWGGMLAQLVTLSHPELVVGLVLIDPAEEDLLASPLAGRPRAGDQLRAGSPG